MIYAEDYHCCVMAVLDKTQEKMSEMCHNSRVKVYAVLSQLLHGGKNQGRDTCINQNDFSL